MDNLLLIASSETDANIYYASGFWAPDPFIYLKTNEKSFLLMSDLEVDRARTQSKADYVFSYSDYEKKVKQNDKRAKFIDVVYVFLKESGVSELTIPSSFSIEYGDTLRALGYKLTIKREPFFEARMIKTFQEVEAIRNTQIAVEEVMEEAINFLRNSQIKEDNLYWEGVLVTSEFIRNRLQLMLMEKGCVAQHTIIACGVDACDPHNVGYGPLRPNQPIIFDIFPRGVARYWADMSRTVVKGKASDRLKRLYDMVLEGQELGISKVRSGASGKAIHDEIMALFNQRGYQTDRVNGRMQGFFHGTGHGVGLDIHELPRIGQDDWILQKGEVITVEPGLYYPDIGAVRIEDMVLVEDMGCRNLTTFPKFLEII